MAASVVLLPDPVGPVTTASPPGLLADCLEYAPHAERLHGGHFGRNGAEHGSGAAALPESVDPEAGEPAHVEGEIRLQQFLVLLALAAVHDAAHGRFEVAGFEGRRIDALEVSVDPQHGLEPRGQVHVGCSPPDAVRQQFPDSLRRTGRLLEFHDDPVCKLSGSRAGQRCRMDTQPGNPPLKDTGPL